MAEQEDTRRVQFTLTEEELQFERAENKSLFDDLDISTISIVDNPLVLMLSHFDNEYMKNERIGVVLFETLTKAIRKYEKMVNENFYYQDMEIIQIVNDLIGRYNTWITNQRGLILSTRDLVRKIKDMNDSEYISLRAHEKEMDKSEKGMFLQLEELKKYQSRAMVMNIDGKKYIEIPKDNPLKEGDLVEYKKSK